MEKNDPLKRFQTYGKIAIILLWLVIVGGLIFAFMNWGLIFPEKQTGIPINKTIENAILTKNDIKFGNEQIPVGGENPPDKAVVELNIISSQTFIKNIPPGAPVFITQQKIFGTYGHESVRKTYWTFQELPDFPVVVKIIHTDVYTHGSDKVESATRDTVYFNDQQMSDRSVGVIFLILCSIFFGMLITSWLNKKYKLRIFGGSGCSCG